MKSSTAAPTAESVPNVQATLFGDDFPIPEDPSSPMDPEGIARGGTIFERFREFDELNPHVFRELLRRALALKNQGATRIGVQMVVEALRYDYAIATTGDPFKMNNDFVAPYARKLAAADPELGRLIETRRSEVDRA